MWQWNDYSGHGYNLIQATTAYQPVYSNLKKQVNFNPTVTFLNNYMDYTVPTGTSIIDRADGSMYVSGFSNVLQQCGFFGFDASNDFPGMHMYNLGSGNFDLLFFTNGGPGYQGQSHDKFAANAPFVTGSTWLNDGGSAAGYLGATVSLNGDTAIYAGQQMYNVNTNAAYNNIRVGWDNNYGALNGELNEMMIFEQKLTPQEMRRVESYLAIKYGATLDSGRADYVNSAGNIVWTAAGNAGNNRNIAGIARDDNGALYQKQSWSMNPGNEVLISTTGLANTNSVNSGSLSDGQYLIWGDNGLAKSPKVPETNIAGTNYRFASVWKVQNTGSVGTVRVAWPAGLPGLKLVQSNDSSFASGNTATGMTANTQTINGVVYNYADVTLADGQYFTFAANVLSPGGIATLPAVWYTPDSVSAAAWKDASLNKLNLAGQGTVTVNAGDAAHNFNTWTAGYSSSDYYNYIDPAASNTDLEANPVFGNYNVNGYAYMPLTVFGVAKDTAASGTGLITGTDNEKANASEPGFGVYAAQQRFYRFSYGAGASGATAPVNVSGVYMWRPPAGASTASGTDTLLMGLNGGYTTAQINKVSSVVGPYLKIGYSASDWGVFPGHIQEVIWYKDSLGYGDIQKVETYLALKFGTTLSHDYINAAGNVVYDLTANAGYVSNIAGIGHEAANGALDQRQSNSVNTGKQILISTTGLDNTNDANTVGLSEGQYLVWGDNGLPKSPGVAIAGVSGVNYRFMSVWKVQNTGSVGTVRVAWPASGLTNLKLIQSSDPAFASGNTGTDMASNTQTVDGVTYNYADVTLADGQYFTLAAQIDHAPGGVVHGLSEWFRADKQVDTTSAGAMVSWTDYTQQVPATQYSTNAVPNYLNGTATNLNFNPGINFTATNQTLANLSIQMLTSLNYDIFSATQSLAGSRYFGGAYNNTTLNGTNFDQPGLYADGSMGTRDNQGNNWYVTNYAPQFAANSPNVMYYHYTDTSFDKGLNGAVVGTNTVHTFHTGAVTGGFVLGYNGGALGGDDAGFTGNIGELIVYGADSITQQERNRVDAYLAIKYGITLDKNESYLASNSNVVFDKTDNAAYYNNIAGIARDDISALNQKQSRSQITNNANGEITVGLGAIATNNAANTNSFTNDQTWFIWGDNGVTSTMDAASASFAAASVGSGVRMTRIWKAVNTGLSQAVELQFPQASVSATTGVHYVLLIANDAGFTANVSAVDLAATPAGSNYTVSFTPRSGTCYFTFARLDNAATPVILKDVSVSTANCNATLSWTGATETSFSYYEVQSSTDGISFIPEQKIDAKGSGSRYTATVPLSAATEYLRLYMVDKDGSGRNSDIYTVNSNCGAATPVLYPNPASDVINIANLGSGQKRIQVFSAGGAVMYKGQTAADKAAVNVKGWPSGIYMVSVVTGNGKTISFKVIVK